MNLMLNSILPGSPESDWFSADVHIIITDGEQGASSVRAIVAIEKTALTNLSPAQIHDLAIDRAFGLLERVLRDRSKAILRSAL